jgi:pyruvate formate lyase activating enzyme
MRTDIVSVAGLQKNSFIDFPGTVSAVLFFSGCNLRCPYCHNPGIVHAQAEDIMHSEDLWNFLEKRSGILDGVVLSGGEPTLHRCCAAVASDIRGLGYSIKLDTNGLLPEKIKEIAPDFLALDIKTTPGNYTKFLHATYNDVGDRLSASIAIAKEMKENAEIRITIAPDITTIEIIEELAYILSGIHSVWLQPMQNTVEMLDPSMQTKKMAPMNEIIEYQKILGATVKNCRIRSGNDMSSVRGYI